MRLRLLSTTTLLVTVALAASAGAQQREPAPGTLAVGADAGFVVTDDVFHVGFTPSAFAEFYLTPRVSIRALGGWSRNQFAAHDDWYLEQFRAAANVTYNWEAELWHPFVTGGVSWHRPRTMVDDGLSSEWSSQAGFNGGFGVEYFVRPKVTFKVEGTYYWVNKDEPLPDPSGLVLSIGMKKYF
jgi:hypothetical protein